MTGGERRTVGELADALLQPHGGKEVPDMQEAMSTCPEACEVIDCEDMACTVTCHEIWLGGDSTHFIHYDAAMAYLQALGVRDET